jgi:hypothetical protein
MINLILVLLNVSSLVIPQLIKDIIVIVMFFTATLLVPMSHLLSLSYFLVDASLGTSTLEPDVTYVLLPVPHLSKSIMLPPFSPVPLRVYTCRPCPSAPTPLPSSSASTCI